MPFDATNGVWNVRHSRRHDAATQDQSANSVSKRRKASCASLPLKYLVPWGDAVFNQAQAGDLTTDIRDVIRSHGGTTLAERLGEVQHLVDRLSAETHVYLWFVGD